MIKINLNEESQIPILGLGTFRNTEKSVVIDTILEALKIGYRHIDTAVAYNNDQYIGEAIKKSNISRDEIFITTKIKIHPDNNLVIRQIENSFKNLATDYIDLVLIHWPSEDHDLNYQTYQVLEDYYQKGLIKAIGVSNYKIDHLRELLKRAKVKPVVNQVELHPGLNQIILQEYLNKYDIRLQSYGPFMKGKVFDEPYKETLELLALRYNTNVASIVIAWGLARNIIMIPMSTNPVNLLSNFNAKNINLRKRDIELINYLNRDERVYQDPDNNNLYLYKE